MTKRRRHTACHEASHAVIGRVLTLYCAGATIKPDYVAREAGRAICHDPSACLHQLIGRTVDDVKVKAPWLLEIHRQASRRRD